MAVHASEHRTLKKPRRLLTVVATAAALAVATLAGASPALASAAPSGAAPAASAPAAAQSTAVTLIPRGSEWKWQYVGSWPTGWNTASFSDSTWRKGTAPLGWGKLTKTTVKYSGSLSRIPLSMQFRKSFTVKDPAALKDVKLSVMADDGVVVYVNGTEVGRKNLPTGKITAASYANKAPNSTAAKELVTFTVPAKALKAGTNVVSASTHLNWRKTPTVGFDAKLVATQGGGLTAPAQSPAPSPTPKPTTSPAPSPQPTTNPAACGAQAKLAPACGALWGVYTTQGANLTSAVTDLESKVDRKFDITLRYHDFSNHQHQGQFPDAAEQALGKDRTLLFAWQSRVSDTKTDIAWARIAKGEMDGFIDSAATRIKAYGQQVMIAFDPEFDNQKKKGPIEDYVRAYQRIHDRFAAKGVTNVTWLWISTGYLGAGNDQHIMDGYPGDKYVDWIGYDPYNFYTCNGTGWSTFEQKVANPYKFFVSQGLGDKPQLLSEYGTSYDPANPTRATQWHKDIPAALKKYPNIKGLVRFNSSGVLSTGEKCSLHLDNGPGMLASFKQAGLDPYVNTRKN